MNAPARAAVFRPLATIFVMQSALTMAAYAFPVVIPVAAADIGMAPESVGFLVATIYTVAMGAGLASGRVVAGFGPTRLFQALLLTTAAAMLALAVGSVATAFLAAALVGVATGPMNPAGSHVLARVTTAKTRALVFSLKQCGTPMGGMLAGAVLPALMLAFDWRIAVMTVAAICAAMLALAPFGRLGDPEPAGAAKSEAGPLQALKIVLTDRAIRGVTLTGFGLAICQMGLATYLVVFLWRKAGFTPAEAGAIFAVLHIAGASSRVVLGLIADRFMSARWVLVAIGAMLCAALLAIAYLTSAWPLAAIYAVVIVAGASGNGWVGLYYAELARLAPAERVADVAAGSQFVTYLGLVSGPVLYGALLRFSDSYQACFLALAAIAALCAGYLALVGGGPTRPPASA